MPTFRGFILQPTYRVESGLPVVHLFGRLEDGRAFLVRDRRLVPRFYVETDDAARAAEKGALRQLRHRPRDVAGPARRARRGRVARGRPPRCAIGSPGPGSPTYEADVRFATRHADRAGHSRRRSRSAATGEPCPASASCSRSPRSSPPTGRPAVASCPSTSRPIPRRGGCSRSACTAAASRRCCC